MIKQKSETFWLPTSEWIQTFSNDLLIYRSGRQDGVAHARAVSTGWSRKMASYSRGVKVESCSSRTGRRETNNYGTALLAKSWGTRILLKSNFASKSNVFRARWLWNEQLVRRISLPKLITPTSKPLFISGKYFPLVGLSWWERSQDTTGITTFSSTLPKEMKVRRLRICYWSLTWTGKIR